MTGYIPPNQQGEDVEPPQKAAIALNFIVVGAGLGGLVAAIALRDAGHSVLVLDARSQADILSETNGESFYAGPNIHRVLTRCGIVLPKQETWQANLTSMRRYSNGELLMHIRTESELHDECGGGEFYAATSTLLKYLYNTAIKHGVEVRFDSRVSGITSDSASVILASGKTLNADVIVGADGPFSVIRKALLGEESKDGTECSDCTGEYLSFRVKEKVIRDSHLQSLLENGEVHIWMGPGSWVCSYPLRDCEEYCVNAVLTCSTPKSCANRRREQVPMSKSIQRRFEDYDETVRQLFALPETVTSTHWRVSESLDSWVRDDGRVVLIGDAAHSTQPTSIASTPNMNLEDGAVLGALYSHLRSPSQIPLLSQTYEDLRMDRSKMALQFDLGFITMCSLPDGPLQEARDDSFRADHESFERRQNITEEAPYGKLWNQRLAVWNYDAWEDVEDWWLRLGRIQQGTLTGSEPPIAVRRLSVGVEKQVQIASEAAS